MDWSNHDHYHAPADHECKATHTAMIVGSIQDTWQVQPDRKGGAPNLKGKHVHHHHDQYTQRMVFHLQPGAGNFHV